MTSPSRPSKPRGASETLDCVVVGAGVVGLAAARALAGDGREVVVVEAADRIGDGTSSRNSEVIHAGLYYKPGSLKALLCLEGRQALYHYCRDRGIEHRRIGKLVVAVEEAQVPALEALLANARANGCAEVRLISGEEARRLEPGLRCVAALESPETGILDTHGFLQSLKADALERGATLALRTPVDGGQVEGGGFALELGGAQPARVRCRTLVNAAGLHAHRLAASLAGLAPGTIPAVRFAKGNYFSLSAPSPFRRLIYPLPVAGGLGIHLTLDVAGRARFGPDVQWVDSIEYSVDPARAAAFEGAVRTWWPALPEGALQPAYSGIRPSLGGPASPSHDFVVQTEAEHGVPGLVNLYGIDSPGLTAALALGERVAAALRR